MTLSASLFSGLTGLVAHQTRMDVIGDNIANVNTAGFKSGRVLFSTAFSRSLGIGSSPTGQLAGVNPQQIGLGAGVSSITKDFSQGSIETTGVATDLAIEGNGFFILRDETGANVFSRDGSFTLNPELYLTNSRGYFLQGFQADSSFRIIPSGTVSPIKIPVGQLTIAKATENADFTGNLNSSGKVASSGSVHLGTALVDSGGVVADALTLLTDLRASGALGTTLLSVGNTLTLAADKGSRDLPANTFAVAAGSTYGELATWLRGQLGINTTAGVPLSPGVSIVGGALRIAGNGGAANDIDNLLLTSDGAVNTPVSFARQATADGESFGSPFTAYDYLGTPVVINVTFSLESSSNTGNTWRWYAETADDSDPDLCVGTGTLQFAGDGTFLSDSGDHMSIDRAGTGATTPVLITPNFAAMTQLADVNSSVALTFQDGASQGTLTGFEVNQNGVVVGIFNNGQIRNLAQVAVANFTNTNGLFSAGNNIFKLGPNSGAPMITQPGALGSGMIMSGALELSNVDLAKEFVDLIVTAAGFSANSRVITTSDQMLNELLAIKR